MCAKFGGSALCRSGDDELWTQRLWFLSSKVKHAKAAEEAHAWKFISGLFATVPGFNPREIIIIMLSAVAWKITHKSQSQKHKQTNENKPTTKISKTWARKLRTRCMMELRLTTGNRHFNTASTITYQRSSLLLGVVSGTTTYHVTFR